MPANLPPEYFAVERLYREAKTVEEKVKHLEELISTIPKHKGTDKIRADYRAKLAKLKSAAQAAKKTGKHASHFHIEKEGAGRVVVIGATNTGKTSLVVKLTHARGEVSELPYTTWEPSPGMAEFENVQIQLIDTPPLDRDFIEPELIELIKSSDLILIMIDIQANPIEQFQYAIEFLNGHKIFPEHQKQQTIDSRLISSPIIVAVNKDDDATLDEDFEVLDELLKNEWVLVPISVKTGRNLNRLMQTIFKQLRIIRVYSKPPGKEVEKTHPFVLKEGSAIKDFAMKVHHDFYEKLRTARVWGKGVFDGQPVGKDHVLYDGDIVELHL